MTRGTPAGQTLKFERSNSSVLVRLGLGIFLALLLYDGALRKWWLPSAEQILFIAKDAIIFALFLYALVNRQANSQGAGASIGPIKVFLTLYAAWVIVEGFNPDLPNFAVGAWGIKSHLLYAAFLLLVPISFTDLSHFFEWAETVYGWLVIPIALLAFAQLLSPPDSLLNQQVRGGMDMMAFFGDDSLVRVAGPFSYITGMASFVQISTLLGLALYIGGARKKIFLLGLAFAFTVLPATGSRSVIVIVVASLLMMVALGLPSGVLRLKSILMLSVAIGLMTAISLMVQQDAWTALQQRTLEVAEIQTDNQRAYTAFTNAFSYAGVSGLIGFGAGAANFGSVALARDVAPFSWLPIGGDFEEESGRIMLELGVIGWTLSLVLRISVLIWALYLSLKGKTREVRLAGILAAPVVALGVHAGNGVFAPPVSAAYYWLCIALLAMAERLNRRILRPHSRISRS